jgi:hypothetical protein
MSLKINSQPAFYADDYKILFFNTDSIDQADTLLVADHHSSLQTQKLFGDLVSSIAENKIVSVFVENIISMRELQTDKKRLKLITQIADSVKDEHLKFYGWDADLQELSDLKRKHMVLSESLLRLITQKEEASEQFNTLENSLKSIFPNFPTISEEEFSTLSEPERISLVINVKKYEVLFFRIQDLEEQLTSTEKEHSETNTLLEEGIRRTFPTRTSAMVETLQKIRNLRIEKNFTDKAIFQGGKAHLETLQKDIGKQEYDLTSLYQELQHHKAAILIPKIIMGI